jgi:hypothetical protein
LWQHEQPSTKNPAAPSSIAVTKDGYSCDSANFGDGGVAFVFVRTDGAKPEGWFFWQS